MKRSNLMCLILVVMTFVTSISMAQEADAEDCKDHSFFNRLQKYYIQECTENYDEYEFVIGSDKTQTLEGTVTKILYTYDGPFGPNLPSRLQVIRNYENAVAKMGGKKIFSKTSEDGSWIGATFHIQKDGFEYWLGIYDLFNNPVDQFTFVLLKREGMKQEITANEMFEKINSGDALTLYINFETAKSAIKKESQPIVDELYQMMKENTSLQILVVGHTDNVGSKASNQTLSEQRAASLKAALVKKGISGDRIKAVGFGQDMPIADNGTEEGKSKNRRVEIKKA